MTHRQDDRAVGGQRWAALTSAELARRIDDRTIAVLPVAAIEQHGPHLPLDVDLAINRAIVAAALARLGAVPSVLVLPTLPIGLSPEHTAFPGTLSLSVETALALWREVAAGAIRSGIRKLVVFNSHGGQTELAGILVQELRARHGILAVAASWFDFGLPDGAVAAGEAAHGIHAGAVETALMMAIAPDSVRAGEVGAFASRSAAIAADFVRIGPLGPAAIGWQTQDLNPAGACGDATAATPALGQAILDHLADALVALLGEVDRLTWPPAPDADG